MSSTSRWSFSSTAHSSFFHIPVSICVRSEKIPCGSGFFMVILGTLSRKGRGIMSNSRKHTLAVITACIAFVIFGFSFMFSSIALSITSTMVLLCFRFTVAVNSLVGRIRGKAWFSFSLKGKPMGGLLLLGIVQPVLYLVFENSSIRYTSSAVTGTVLAVVPVICILADVFISRESVSKLQVVCAVACVAGVALVETGGETRISFLGFFCLLMT